MANSSLTKAYRYGSDYVVLPSSLEEELSYKTYAGLDIRGFMDSKKLERRLLSSESVFIVSNEQDENQKAFSALVDAMRNIDKVAIARYVPKNNSAVHMVMLYPMILISEDGEKVRALVLNQLPYSEEDMLTLYPRLDSEKNDAIDSMMERFVESRDLDQYPRVAEDKYFAFYKDTERDTTLPLPLYKSEQVRLEDPLIVPAVSLHRQLHVLLEYIHQVLINESDTFCVPELSDSLKDKITPHVTQQYDNLAELVKMLGVKKAEPKSTTTMKEQDAEPLSLIHI